MHMPNTTEIKMPVIKASSAIALAAGAQADAADKIAQAASSNASYATWVWVNSIPWGTIASIVAAIYTSLLICEWLWKKIVRPLAERWKWIKPRKTRVVLFEDYQKMTDTQRAEL